MFVPEVEELTEGEPEETVVENARRKARAGKGMLVRGLQPPKLAGAGNGVAGGERSLVLGVDTEVVLDGRLLGKAADEREARDRLEALSGRTHDVLGGVMVIGRRDDSTWTLSATARQSPVSAGMHLPRCPATKSPNAGASRSLE